MIQSERSGQRWDPAKPLGDQIRITIRITASFLNDYPVCFNLKLI